MNCCQDCGYWNRELIFSGSKRICSQCFKLAEINRNWEEYYNSQEKEKSTPTVTFQEIADIREFKKGELHYTPRKKYPSRSWKCQKKKE